MDFVADSVAGWDSVPFADDRRCLYTREAVAIEVGQSLKGDDVVRTLNKLKLEPRCNEGAVLRQRQRVHQSCDGSMGLSGME